MVTLPIERGVAACLTVALLSASALAAADSANWRGLMRATGYENTPVAPCRKNGRYAPITFLPSPLKAAQASAQFLHGA
jgi:hypothetical protein